MLADTDHFAPGGGDALWAWRTFLRGHHPILMDFGIIGGLPPADPTAGGAMSFDAFEPARFAMGDTARYAQRVNLLAMEPDVGLSSTGFALVNPGVEYLVLQQEPGAPFTVTLPEGTYAVEWFSVDDRTTERPDAVSADGDGAVSFAPPFDTSPSVLFLRAVR